MEDSFRGVIVAIALVGIFMMAMINFIIGFPISQGVSFNSTNQYLTLQSASSEITSSTSNNLGTLEGGAVNSTSDWSVTVGFMGTNALKEKNRVNSQGLLTSTFSNFKTLASQIFGFGLDSPVILVISILTTLAGIYLTFMLVQFIRTGR